MTSGQRGGALKGVRVLDCSRVLAGPWTAQMLGDMGADVIKIERPVTGDDSRAFGPPFFKGSDGRDTARSAMFHSANRNKRAITLNLASPDGQRILKRLAESADVLIENYKVGTLARYGLGYVDLASINPRLIYCSITGFGQSGPYAPRPGYDPIVQAASGMMSVTGFPMDQPGGGPMKAGPSIVDLAAGFYASSAILAALYDRDRGSGAGQQLDISLLDVGVGLMSHPAATYFITGTSPGLVGTQANGGVPGGGFWCADGYIMIAPGSEQLYRAFCHAIGRPDLAEDPRFRTNGDRVRNRRALMDILEALIRTIPVADMHDNMIAAGVPSSPVYDVEQVLADPQIRERGIEIIVDHPSTGPTGMIGNPVKASGALMTEHSAPPDVGEHNHAILGGELGLSDAEIDSLYTEGVI